MQVELSGLILARKFNCFLNVDKPYTLLDFFKFKQIVTNQPKFVTENYNYMKWQPSGW